MQVWREISGREVMNTVAYLINRSSSTAIEFKTLEEVWSASLLVIQILEYLDVLHMYIFRVMSEGNLTLNG